MSETNEANLDAGILRAIQARHSIRAYSPTPLDSATIQILLDAAVRASTAMHEEPWAFVVIQNKQILKQLSDQAKTAFCGRGAPS